MHDIAKQRYELVRFSLALYGVVVKEVRARKERQKTTKWTEVRKKESMWTNGEAGKRSVN